MWQSGRTFVFTFSQTQIKLEKLLLLPGRLQVRKKIILKGKKFFLISDFHEFLHFQPGNFGC